MGTSSSIWLFLTKTTKMEQRMTSASNFCSPDTSSSIWLFLITTTKMERRMMSASNFCSPDTRVTTVAAASDDDAAAAAATSAAVQLSTPYKSDVSDIRINTTTAADAS